ncbi:ciliogenesis-associated TTC17-interacting protein-like [Coregonus clupeaformis]|uniref:ciliogenesis-associated TTC17-interacting protein-like n=1 Tax=Coregonus clupeaformis TaxID=59861 RepID=UPI001BDF91B9|nr:ciliogenesis-associated TTC17-interacting protein-like [Coregonus clupeaformis]
MQIHSEFLKEELKAEHASYLQQHPVLRAMMSDFLQFLLLQKPSNVIMFAREDFSFSAPADPRGAPSTPLHLEDTLWLHLDSLVASAHRHFSEDNTILVSSCH